MLSEKVLAVQAMVIAAVLGCEYWASAGNATRERVERYSSNHTISVQFSDFLHMHAGGPDCSKCCCFWANMFWQFIKAITSSCPDNGIHTQ
jgi:hypothetical protein